jgi:hypothetical protein
MSFSTAGQSASVAPRRSAGEPRGAALRSAPPWEGESDGQDSQSRFEKCTHGSVTPRVTGY